MTKRSPIWQAIAEALRRDLAAGVHGEGDKLPTEAALSARFGVNRHTVRQALAALGQEGLVVSRRGAGVFVAGRPPADYPLGRRVRFHQNLSATGRAPSREITLNETRRARPEEAEALGVDLVHVLEGVSLGDALPMAVFRSVFPAERFPALPEALGRLKSVTAALRESGVEDYTRKSTRITARLARGPRALLLKLPEGAPVLRTEAVNVDADGRPVEYGRTWFSGDRVALTVTPEA